MDPILKTPGKESMKIDTVAELAKAYGPLGLPTSGGTKSGGKSQSCTYKTPASVPLSPARYLMFRQPSQTGSVTARLKPVKNKARPSVAHQRKKSRTVVESPTIPVSAKGSKILNIKKYEREVNPKASVSNSKASPSTPQSGPNLAKAKVSKTSVRSRPNPQTQNPLPAIAKSRSRSLEHDPRPSAASIVNSSMEVLPNVPELQSVEFEGQIRDTINDTAIENVSAGIAGRRKCGKPASVKSMRSLKNVSTTAKQMADTKAEAIVAIGSMSEENSVSKGKGSSMLKAKESRTARNIDDSRSTISQSGTSESAPLKGILKATKSYLDKSTASPLSNVGLCIAQPGTPEWTNYWDKYDRALANYKLSEAAFLHENQSFRQDIEKYSKEAARITLEDAIFRQSIGLEPKKIHEVIGHPITELTTLNGFVFDRNCGSEGLVAYLSSSGSKGFRLEVDVRGHDPDKVKVEADFNLVKILVPFSNDLNKGNRHKSIVIGLPHEYDLKDLEVFPVRNGWLVIESKEKKIIE
jgi:hypothetical protein